MAFLALVVLTLGACALPTPGPDPCAVTGGAPRSDVARARDACTQARRRFATVIGVVPPGTINLSATDGLSTFTQGGRWSLTWPMTSRLVAGQASGARSDSITRRFLDEQWREVLPHELGHIMLGAFLYSPGRVMTGEYGTYMPDWVDEAVAISMEPDDVRAARVRQAREFTSAPSLAEVLGFRHPYSGTRGEAFSTRVVSSPPCDGPCRRERPTDTRIITERVFRDGRVTVDTTYVAGERPLEADPLARFYILSYALWAYLEARGGRDATDLLIERLRRNPRDAGAIAGLPGLPRTAAGVEADWRRWLAATAATD
jgi:hypothetical protein